MNPVDKNTPVENHIEKRIRRSSILIAAGLLIQLLSLLPVHPLAFIVFLAIGCPLMLAGIAMYLTSLLAEQSE